MNWRWIMLNYGIFKLARARSENQGSYTLHELPRLIAVSWLTATNNHLRQNLCWVSMYAAGIIVHLVYLSLWLSVVAGLLAKAEQHYLDTTFHYRFPSSRKVFSSVHPLYNYPEVYWWHLLAWLPCPAKLAVPNELSRRVAHVFASARVGSLGRSIWA
jgi:hypothetical protein